MRRLALLFILIACLSVTAVCSVVAEENSVSTLKKETKGKALTIYAPRPEYPLQARRKSTHWFGHSITGGRQTHRIRNIRKNVAEHGPQNP